MTLRQLFIRFTLVYLGAIIVFTATAVWLDLNNSSLNGGALCGAVFYACGKFMEKNGRRFSSEERSAAWKGMLAIDTAMQLGVLGLMSAVGEGPSMLSGTLLFAIGFVVVLHAAVIFFLVKVSDYFFDKQQAAIARKAQKKAQKLAARSNSTARPPVLDKPTPRQGSNFSDTVPLELK